MVDKNTEWLIGTTITPWASFLCCWCNYWFLSYSFPYVLDFSYYCIVRTYIVLFECNNVFNDLAHAINRRRIHLRHFYTVRNVRSISTYIYIYIYIGRKSWVTNIYNIFSINFLEANSNQTLSPDNPFRCKNKWKNKLHSCLSVREFLRTRKFSQATVVCI